MLSVRAGDGLSLEFALEDMVGEGFAARGVSLALEQRDAGRFDILLRVQRLELAAGSRHLSDVRLHCPAARASAAVYRCEQGELSLVDPVLGPQRLPLQFRYTAAEDWWLGFSGLRVAAGSVSGELQAADGGWQGRLRGERLKLAELSDLLPNWQMPSGWQLGGRLKAGLSFAGKGDRLSALSVSLQGKALSYSDADGLNAAEGLALDLSADMHRPAADWRGRLSLKINQGQLYSDPVFVEFKPPLTLHSRFSLPAQADAIALQDLALTWPGLLQLTGDGRFDLTTRAVHDLALQLKADDLSRLYPVLLQPLLLGTVLEDVSLAGRLDGGLSLHDGAMQAVSLRLAGLHLDDSRARFGIYGLEAGLFWRNSGEAPDSFLRLDAGHVYQIDIGSTGASLSARGDRLQLLAPLEVPLLDGHISLGRLQLEGLKGDSELAWQASAEVEGLSLSLLSHRLGWPLISGELNGRIPGLSYRDRVMALDGQLAVQALGGEITVSGMKLTEPMGTVPVLEAEAQMHGLDLEALTKAFSFGRITGSLDGEVRALQLVGWQPASFVADFYSTPGDRTPHRISQRAVDNLTELGNGFSAGLSTTFLRFFKDFAYDRIRLAVKLEGQTAELDGLAHKGGGYYLVKGRGLPRIDVVGRNRRVAWRDLVGRLKTIRFEDLRLER